MDFLWKEVESLKSDFNVWMADAETTKAVVVSQRGNVNTLLKFLPTFHLVVTIDDNWSNRLSLYLLAFNGKVVKTDSIESKLGCFKSSSLFSELKNCDTKLCLGVSNEYTSTDLIQEYMGDTIVKRSINCQYVSRKGHKMQICDECSSIVESFSEDDKNDISKIELSEDLVLPKIEESVEFNLFNLSCPTQDEKSKIPTKRQKKVLKKETVKVEPDIYQNETEADFDFDLRESEISEGDEEVESSPKKRRKRKRPERKKYKLTEDQKLKLQEIMPIMNISGDLIDKNPNLVFEAHCSLCLHSTKCEKFFLDHVQQHLDNIPKLNEESSCTECGIGFSSKWEVIPHMMREHKIQHIICPFCPKKVFKVRACLYSHIQRSHNSTENQKLHELNQKLHDLLPTTSMPNDLIILMIKNLEEDMEFYCSLCLTGAKDEKTFLEHVQHHLDDLYTLNEESPCVKCSMKFASKWEVIPHMMREHNIQDVICPFCPEQIFKNPRSLCQHIKRFHSKRGKNVLSYERTMVTCPECGASFQKYHLTNHLKQQHPNRSDPKIVCELCGYSCHNQSQMKSHMRRKHPSKLFTCNLCYVIKGRWSTFQQHYYEKHGAAKPHKCGLCEYRSARRSNILIHIRKMHKEILKEDENKHIVKDGEFEILTDEDLARLCTIQSVDPVKELPKFRGKNKEISPKQETFIDL